MFSKRNESLTVINIPHKMTHKIYIEETIDFSYPADCSPDYNIIFGLQLILPLVV